ncbi:hypothetical protein ACWOB1_04865 [Facklamia languida]|uniref:Uncharacterized protein n=1 Tax=Facklamia languida CCUG 37842 TaxID=883113 RepID=H3NJD5_9LACT|nr:hypothetical protein [Facklamia languida]EHR36748.1 hypothetical protein HMPREF9708_00974 [Facklamia languida CCUG 37842]
MKSKITIISCVVLCIVALNGCGKVEKYSKAEQEAIKAANSIVGEKYKIEIDESKYLYSVGKQLSENEFVDLDNDTVQENQYQNVISVSAMNNRPDKKDEILSFAVIYNKQTKDIILNNVNR